MQTKDQRVSFVPTLMAGAMAGLSVDISLYPLDTIKTRLQSAGGFWKAGGFRGIYAGIGSVAVGSSPGSAVFFCTYEAIKSLFHHLGPCNRNSFVHMFAASCGEVGIRGLYRGYFSTVFREIPFSLIQFPIWEKLKVEWSLRQKHPVKPWQSSFCGAIAGSIAAAMTTPLDVVKTRIMLAKKGSHTAKGNVILVMRSVWIENGIRGLFSGICPRVLWISIGGAVFFGAYEKSKEMLMSL